jgi:hypothetical protein
MDFTGIEWRIFRSLLSLALISHYWSCSVSPMKETPGLRRTAVLLEARRRKCPAVCCSMFGFVLSFATIVVSESNPAAHTRAFLSTTMGAWYLRFDSGQTRFSTALSCLAIRVHTERDSPFVGLLCSTT